MSNLPSPATRTNDLLHGRVNEIADVNLIAHSLGGMLKPVAGALGIHGLGSHDHTPAPVAPSVLAPVVMPLPDSASVAAAQRRQQDLLAAGGGRASTILSQQSDTLG